MYVCYLKIYVKIRSHPATSLPQSLYHLPPSSRQLLKLPILLPVPVGLAHFASGHLHEILPQPGINGPDSSMVHDILFNAIS